MTAARFPVPGSRFRGGGGAAPGRRRRPGGAAREAGPRPPRPAAPALPGAGSQRRPAADVARPGSEEGPRGWRCPTPAAAAETRLDTLLLLLVRPEGQNQAGVTPSPIPGQHSSCWPLVAMELKNVTPNSHMLKTWQTKERL
ncbi:translation initiation factor IF-2-like [Cervus canadensis]|uniref:translation initiation factor IF-2-like n=1 Tax=Cervus canadensis TaxID=1574408 RepID=UPI001CA30FF3|nr:translation initiation factor IF-2-like [Cervus canadensis]